MLALDESKESDNVIEVNGFLFVVDKSFYNRFKPIKVEFSHFGFAITAAVNYGASYFSCSYNGSG